MSVGPFVRMGVDQRAVGPGAGGLSRCRDGGSRQARTDGRERGGETDRRPPSKTPVGLRLPPGGVRRS